MSQGSESWGEEWPRQWSQWEIISSNQPAQASHTCRLNSEDISGCGGHLPAEVIDRKEPYPPDLELSEEEEAAGLFYQSLQPATPPLAPISSRNATRPTRALLPRRDSSRPTYVTSASVFQSPGSPHLPNEQPAMQGQTRQANSSVQDTDGSEYRSAAVYPPSHTTYDVPYGGDNAAEVPHRTSTLFFTPSHTPSHRSLETTEDEEKGEKNDSEARGPQSPYPYSNEDRYNAGYGRDAVRGFDQLPLMAYASLEAVDTGTIT